MSLTKGIPEWQTGIADIGNYVDGEYNHIISVLNMYQEEPSMWESYDKYVWSEPVRSDKVYFCCRNRCDSGHHKSQWKAFVTKRKEVK